MTDWSKEADALGTSNFWKPETGTYQVRFLNEGEPDSYTDPRTEKVTDQMVFEIEADGQPMKWSVTKARTVNSLWGQIALFGRSNGSLAEKTITLLVKYDQKNNKREYTVQEALPLITEYNRQQGKRVGTISEEPQGSSFLDKIFSDAT